MPYFKPNNKKFKSVVHQENIHKSKKLQFRLSGDELVLFDEYKSREGIKNKSEFLRNTIMDKIYKEEIKRQEYEVSDIV